MTAHATTPPTSPLRTVVPNRLVDDVVARLRRYLAENELAAGDRLPSERSLAGQLGTSRATVAQALRILAVMGLVDIRHGSGIYARQDPTSLFGTTFGLMLEMEPASVGELAEFRFWIEKHLLADDTIPAFDGEQLVAHYDAMATAENHLERWIEADADFHCTLVAATRNSYLQATYGMAHRQILSASYSEWIERGSAPSWLRGEGWTAQLDLHGRILRAALDRDRSGLVEALEAHQEVLMAHLAEAAGSGS